jgi:predicted TPR repeat methyltransferase
MQQGQNSYACPSLRTSRVRYLRVRSHQEKLQLMLNWIRKVIAGKSQFPQRNPAQEPAATSPALTATHEPVTDLKHRGDQCLDDGAIVQAIEYYRQALAIRPDFAEALHKLGDALREQGKQDEAISCYRRAIASAPDEAQHHFSLGVAQLETSDLPNATACFERAVALKPDFVRAHNSLGFILLESGRPAEAVARFQKSLSFDPENGMALHMIASLTGSNPERAPSQYIEKLFDGFASTFDAHLQHLKYETPKHLVALIAHVCTPVAGKWNVLDLGCGTGLSGVAIAPYASELVGVDLSAKMLQKARDRNIYHRLECMDLIAMLQVEKSANYDVVLAADSFIYLGNLDRVAREVRRVLRPGGFFAFSVEALEALPAVAPRNVVHPGYQLQENPSCRYAHSSEYISRLASDNNFKIHELKMTHIRMSGGSSVNGYLVLLES